MSIEVSNSFVEPVMDADKVKNYMEKFQKLKAALITAEDTVNIQGKPYIKRSGYRKFALAFNISDEIVKEEKETVNDMGEHSPFGRNTIWTIHVKATAPNGRSAVGVARCSSSEKKFAHADHDVYAIAHTRAKNRAISDLIGSGEVSAEEMSAMDANAKAANLFQGGAKK